MPFKFTRLEVPDVILVQPKVLEDARGHFIELYKRTEFAAHGIPDAFVQDNYSSSVRGVLRGLHYQRPPQAQAKLVMVLRGEIFDVVVDLRRDSPAYGRWTGVMLSSSDRRMLYVPEGLAHGFCVTSDAADVMYKVTAEYTPELEGGVRWNDPAVGIRWPIADPIVSEKDAALPLLRDIQHDVIGYGSRR